MLVPRKALVVDDHPLVLKAFAELLSDCFADCVVDQIDELRHLPGHTTACDLILLDIAMPGGGIDFIREVRNRFPQALIVIITGSESLEQVKHCLRLGARGYVLKSMTPDEIGTAIRHVLSGGIFIPKAARMAQKHARAQAMSGLGDSGQTRPLTPTQYRVLDLLLQGKRNKEIADALLISDGTAKNHVSAVLTAFAVGGRQQLLALFQRALLPHSDRDDGD